MTAKPEPDRLDAIRRRHAVLAARTWEAKPHQHGASGCRCLSCYDDPTGWQIDHPGALDCEELVASTTNDFGRDRGSCDAGPLLSYEEADALAHAAEDIGFLLAAPAVVSSPPATDRATVRDRIRRVLAQSDGFDFDSLEPHDYQIQAAALLAALPDDGRATILREAADRYEGILAKANTGQDPRYWTAVRDITLGLRRMADEAQPEPAPAAVERVARRLAGAWITEAEWDRYSETFREDYRNYAREVVALAEPAAGARQPDTETLRPARGDQFEAWLKAQRDEYEVRSSPQWGALDEALDTYRLHADTGTPLDRHACDGPHCDCPPSAGGSGAADETRGETRSPVPSVEPCPPGCVACATDESHDPAPAVSGRPAADDSSEETP